MIDVLTFAASSPAHWHAFLIMLLIPATVLLVATEMLMTRDCSGISIAAVIILCFVVMFTWGAMH